MKNLILIAATALFLVSGCKKADEFTKFDIDYSTSVTIPVTSDISAPFDFYSPDIDSDYEAKFKQFQTASDKVESIKTKSLKVKITSPSGANLDFLKSLEIYFEGEGFGPVRYAWKDDVADGIEEMSIDVSDKDLKELIVSGKFKIKATATLDQATTVDHNINLDCTFEVDAKLL